MTVRLLAPQFRSSRDQIHVPPDKVRIIPTEGNTNLIRALQSIVKYFDSDEATSRGGGNLHRAVLIITDADVDEVPSAELAALNQRNIVPYMIYINIRDAGGGTEASEAPPLIDMIQEFGGDYFDVTDESSLTRAYEAIDELEAVRVELTHRAVKTPIYPRLLLVSLALFVVGIPAGFLAELSGVRIRRSPWQKPRCIRAAMRHNHLGLRPKPPAAASGDPVAPRRVHRGAPCAACQPGASPLSVLRGVSPRTPWTGGILRGWASGLLAARMGGVACANLCSSRC